MAFIPAKASAWFEIPVTDMDRARAFYGSVLQNDLILEESGPNPMAMFAAEDRTASGHIYPGKPAAPGNGPTIHLSVAAPIEDAMERVRQNGGQIVSPAISIPAGTFAYCLDPDGNSFGLFV
ncbi:VOC family protein [Mesorhizobium sp. BHbsci]|uniref:VOC family protein n=1 Tax=unclassified Mesorhizobium TaxID=325217 RepID=UPI000FCC87D1|nr:MULTISPECIES: VOC family protein [unclassified Mesorhizobium]RUV56618.1 VOC family protein [Mesorhizobium sp. M5C.F.Ca.IN.020.29.1.1]RWF75944.1 MAG: VOC family protein [Mesorhizobium sp.]TIM85762.1 MAG: VOC family protein [Mesorhizobium sp.]